MRLAKWRLGCKGLKAARSPEAEFSSRLLGTGEADVPTPLLGMGGWCYHALGSVFCCSRWDWGTWGLTISHIWEGSCVTVGTCQRSHGSVKPGASIVSLPL